MDLIPITIFLAVILLGVLPLASVVILLALCERLSKVERLLNKAQTPLETKATPPEPAPLAIKQETPPPPAPEAIKKDIPAFESGASNAIEKIWNWILVGEEREGVSLEYAVATTWLTRVGIVIILAAVAFGINYSIKNGLIGPAGRVAMGFASGILMTVWGLSMAKGRYRTAAQGLIGGGLAALYFSAFASSMLYHLIAQPAAFALMALITAACCVVAVSVDSLLIALLGTLGGYLTPVILSTGEKNLTGLFAYMTLLGLGLLFVARKRDWMILNALCMIFTYAIYFLALGKFYDKALDYPTAMVFGSTFFLIFSLSPLLYILKNKKPSTALELLLMTINSAVFFTSAHMLTTAKFPEAFAAIPCLALAAYHILFAWLLRLRRDDDKELFSMLFAFASFFVAFSFPLLLGGQWVTAAWSLQALAMLWLANRIGGTLLPRLSYALYFVAAMRILIIDLPCDFRALDASSYLPQLPGRLGSFGSFIASLAAAWLLLRRQKENAIPACFLALSTLTLFTYLTLELRALTHIWTPDFSAGTVSVLWGLFALGMLIPGIRRNATPLRIAGLVLFLITAVKIFTIDLASLSQLARIAAFLALGIATLAGAFFYMHFKNVFEKDAGGQ